MKDYYFGLAYGWLSGAACVFAWPGKGSLILAIASVLVYFALAFFALGAKYGSGNDDGEP